jgi:uncharacterized RDD family membrane protein YckC
MNRPASDPFESRHNPFAPPETADFVDENREGGPPLAGLGARLGGAILDGLLLAPVTFGLMFAYLSGQGGFAALDQMSAVEQVKLNLIVGVAGVAWYLVLNGYLLANKGQTVGKLVCRTRIVDAQTGQRVSFWRIILRRWLLIQLIVFIPIIGPLTNLVGILMIFRENRRCLHDVLADTKVVEAV